MPQPLCLRWNDHMNSVMEVFQNLLSTETLADVTLACDGLSLKAHKIVLSACSPFFQSLFLENPCKHPIVIVKDMSYTDLKAVVDFMYHGELYVAHEQLSSLIEAARTLKVKGLSDVSKDEQQYSDESGDSWVNTPPAKRKKRRTRKRSMHHQNDGEFLQCKSVCRDPDMENLSRCSDIEELPSTASHSTVPTSTPAKRLLTPCKLPSLTIKSEFVVEEPVEEEEESMFIPEFAMLLRQSATKENSRDMPMQFKEPEDDFLMEAANKQQPLAEKELSKTTVQFNVPTHPSSDIDDLFTRPNSDIDELPTHPNSDIDDLATRPNSDIEHPTHQGSDIDEMIQSNTELPQQPHSTDPQSSQYCTVNSNCSYHSTHVIASSSGLGSSDSGTSAPTVADPSAKDPRTESSTDLNGHEEAITQTRKELVVPQQEASENRFIDAGCQTVSTVRHLLPEEKDDTTSSDSADENNHMNINVPKKKSTSTNSSSRVSLILKSSKNSCIPGPTDSHLKGSVDENTHADINMPKKKSTSANSSSRKPLILKIPKNACIPRYEDSEGFQDSQLKEHQRAKGGRPRKIRRIKRSKLRKQPQRSTNHTSAFIPDTGTSKPPETTIGHHLRSKEIAVVGRPKVAVTVEKTKGISSCKKTPKQLNNKSTNLGANVTINIR